MIILKYFNIFKLFLKILVYSYSNPFTTLTNAFFKYIKIIEHKSKERKAFYLLSVTNIKIQSILVVMVIIE